MSVLGGTLLEVGVTPIANRTLTLTLGALSCTAATNAAGVASCPVQSPTGTTTAPFAASFPGDAYYEPAADQHVVTLEIPTTLTYTGATTGDPRDTRRRERCATPRHARGAGDGLPDPAWQSPAR
jgi:hypothetical protein